MEWKYPHLYREKKKEKEYQDPLIKKKMIMEIFLFLEMIIQTHFFEIYKLVFMFRNNHINSFWDIKHILC